jgi:hypothetical protein
MDAAGFIDIAPTMLAKLRQDAREQEKLNTYTWIAPGHVLALLDTIDELEAALADTTAKLIRLNVESPPR